LSFSLTIAGIAVGDVDGDGKPDLIVGSGSLNTNISVYSTIANGGYINGSSTPSNTLVATNGVNGIAVGDIDGDGKPDILATGGNTVNQVDVFRNTTAAGSSSSFAARLSVNNGTNKPYGIALGDVDGDGKLDIVDCNKIATAGSGAVTVIINTSTPGAVSFGTATNFSTGSGVTTPLNLIATDLDGDGKADIAVVNNGGSSVSLFRSTTTTGSTTPTLDTRIDLTENSTPYGIAVGDINGDGKPDLVVGNSTSSAYVSIFTNTSTVGALSFAAKVDLTSGTANPQIVAIQDIDGDGRPDILVPNNNGATASSISIFHIYPVTPPVLTTVSPLKGNVGTSVTITGNYFSATAANDVVYFGAVKATVTSASTTQLIVTVPAGASYAPISVLNNETTNRPSTGYSQQFFTTTFTSKNAITDQDIDLQTTISATGTSPGAIFSADLNGDGLPDMVVLNNINAANNISIYMHNSPNSNYTSAYPSTPTYNLSTTLTTINQWSPIIAGDVDGDGKPDLLVAPYNASNFTYVYLSSTASGGALFGTTPITLTGTSVPRGIAIADLDGDGKVDIAVANGTGSTVSVFRNTSSGGTTSFAAGVAISNGASVNAYGIAIGDIDGDGKPDIVTTNESTTVGAGSISIIRNVASPGAFSATSGVSFITPTALANTILPTGISTVTTKPFSLALGDLDGDGKIDIAVTNYSTNTVSVFRNTSTTNTFSFDNATSSNTTTNIANVSYTTGTSPGAVSIADMDGDGKPDLVVSNYGSPTVSIFRNNTTSGATLSSSSFAGKVDYTVGSGPSTIAVQDIDLDGKPDILVPNLTSNTISILHNAPTSAPVISSFTPTSGAAGATMTISGTNFSTTAANNSIYFGGVKATASGATATQITVTIPTGAQYGPIAVQNSASTHPVIGYSVTPFIPTFLSKNNITAGDFDSRIDISSATSAKSILIVDVDGDGKPDIVMNIGSANMYIFRQSTNSSGNLSSAYFDSPVQVALGTNNNLTLNAFADIDGDGKPDMVFVSNNVNNRVVVMRNTTTGSTISFGTLVVISTPSGSMPNGITFADLDGDGRLDMVVTNTALNNISVFRNISTSVATTSFATSVQFSTGTYPYAVKAADLDGDGKMDLVVSNSGDNTISVFRNTSTGTSSIAFASASTFATGTYPEIPVLGDLDGDGKIDIIVPNFAATSWGVIQDNGSAGTGTTISVFHNTSASGTINFDTQQTFTTGTAPVIAALADMDGDGKPDVVVGNNGISGNNASKTVSILRNTSTSGTISLSAKVDLTTTSSGSSNITGIAVGDLDGDGKPDIAIANNNSTGLISLFRNDPTIPLVTTTSGSTTFTATSGTGTPVAIDGSLTVSEVNRTTLASTTVSVTTGFLSSEDVLAFSNDGSTMGNIAGSYDSSAGILTLTSSGATATLAQFQAALRSVTYSNTNSATNTTGRTISFAANDGTQTGPATTKAIIIVSANATLSTLSLSTGTLSPAFAVNTSSYTASVSNATASITVTPTVAVSGATVKLNGIAVTSGTASGNISLNVGTNTITTLVTAKDGTTTNTYTTVVTRLSNDATLSALALSSGTLNPSFASGTASYTASVGNSTTSVTVTPTVNEPNATVKVNGIVVASGTASGGISLNVGTNAITTIVTAQDGTTNTYTAVVTRLSNDATLSALALSSGTLSPSFASGTTSYTATVSNATTSVTVTPTVNEPNATIKVNGTTVASGTASGAIGLNVGTNTITTLVNAQDGTTNSYTTVVTRAASSDATLSALLLSSGTLSPVFTSAATSYTTSVSNATTSVTVTLTVNEPNATVKVNGTVVASGTASGGISLNVGTNTITTLVTAQDGTTNTYTTVVTRAASSDATLSALLLSSGTLSPSFASATTSYTASVSNATTSVTVTPTVNEPNATIKVNGTTVGSGTTSGGISLNVGTNTITTIVTAQDGTTNTYTTVVTRLSNDAALSTLALSSGTLSPSFASATTSYTASVSNATTSLTVTPTVNEPNATIKVNGTTVASGTASGNISLNVGTNTVTTIVTAQDGTTNTYTTVVTRLSNDATLSALALSSGTLSPSFTSVTTSYTVSVSNSTTSVTVTPTVNEPNATIKVNGTTVASGTASGGISLNVGTNAITTIVTAQDGTTNTYTTVVTRLSNDATLSALALSSGTLSPSFASATTSYTASVSNATTSVTVTPTVNQANATVKVNGITVTSGTASGNISLNVGTNTITTIVTAQDGTTNTYTTVVTRLSNDATLSALALSSGTLNPSFASGTTSYTASVSNATTSVTVTPTVNEPNATVKVNGIVVASGTASGGISLNVGTNTITTIVTAQDGTTNTYTAIVTRLSNDATLSALALSSGTLSPSFASGTTSYTALVSNATTSVTVTPTVNEPNATVKVNGITVTSGTASGGISLNVGMNTITTLVTAQDGTTNTYTTIVTRLSNDATLSALALSSGTLNPSFASGTASYTASVGNSTTSVTVTPTVNEPNATVKVNGIVVASGTASGGISLNVGTNTITTIVTAQDGTTNTYTTVVTRLSNDATLSALALSSGTLSPSFTSVTTSYTVSVSNATTSVTVTPTVNQANATVKVNGITVTSGTASGGISLNVGMNTITTLVTAQDGTTNTYITVVTRAASSDATLSAILLSSGTLSPSFASGTTSYTASVGNSTTSVTVTPTVNEPNATVKVNGITVTSGTASGGISLNVGANTITTMVTAQDGTTNTYTTVVTRAASSNADLASLNVNPGTLTPGFSVATTNYATGVINTTPSVTVTATVADATASLTINGIAVASGSPAVITVNSGLNTINAIVTAQDGTTKTYIINVTKSSLSNDALLASLAISSGTLSPIFASGTNNYTASVSNGVNSITVTPTVNQINASVTVNGNAVVSGNASGSINLNVGTNTINTLVMAQDGITQSTYTIMVTRAASSDATLAGLTLSNGILSPAFASGTINYTAAVSNAVTSLTITPTVNQGNATITVNGTSIASGVSSGLISLNVGTNIITTVVTAQDGITSKTYITTITRAASSNNNLANIIISSGSLSPAFATGTTSYTATVGGNIASINITPTTVDASATLTINGIAVTSGNPSGNIGLNVGNSSIAIVVTAQNGTTQTYTLLITRLNIPQTITFNTLGSSVYGDADFAAGATSTNNSIPITYTSSNAAVATITAGGLIHIVGVGNANITASQSGDATYAAAAPVTQSLTVNRAALTITALNALKTYGAVNPTLSITYSGFVNGDTNTSLSTQPTVTTTAVTGSPVGNYPIIASGAVAANYNISYTAGTLTVTRATLTIAVNNATKVYGATNPALSLTYTGFVSTDNAASLTTQPTITTTAVTTSPVGTYPITVSGAVSANYNISYTGGTLTVTQATLTIAANNATKVYGSANPTLGVTYTGFVGTDNAASLTTQPGITTTAVTGSPVGVYPITVSGAVSANYSISYTAGTLTVTPATLTIAVSNATKVYGASNPTFGVTYTGFIGTDNAASLATQPGITTTAVTGSPVGAYPITASGAVSANYSIS
jgi:hypothetical protein